MIDAEELEKKEMEIARLSEELKMENRNQAIKANLPRIMNLPTSLTPTRKKL